MPPDRCFCDGRNHTIHGAACKGHAQLDCGFCARDGDTFADVLSTLATVGQLTAVTNLTLTNAYACGLTWNDAEYGAIGAAIGSAPLRSRLVHLELLDQRELGPTESSEGLAAFGNGVGNMTSLRALKLDNRHALGLGSLRCHSAASSVAMPGLARFGEAIARLAPTLRVLDLNFDAPNGAYSICDGAVAAFADRGISKLTRLYAITLGFNFQSIADHGARAIGNALSGMPGLRGVNVRLRGSFATPPRGIAVSGQGLASLMASLARLPLISLALMLGDGSVDYGPAGIAGVASGLARLNGTLEALWLALEDKCQTAFQPCKRDLSGLVTALGHLQRLRGLHCDILCLSCAKPTPWQCAGHDPPLASVVAGKCLECGQAPFSDPCNCWERGSYGCSVCDEGDLAVDSRGCTDFVGEK